MPSFHLPFRLRPENLGEPSFRIWIAGWRLHHPMDPKTWSEDYVKAITATAPPPQER